MAKVIKIIQDSTISQLPNEDIIMYIGRVAKIVPSEYILQLNEIEITSIEVLNILKKAFIIDRRSYRSGLIRVEELAAGFSNLTQAEQEELSRKFATNSVNIATTITDIWERIANGLTDFHEPMVESRTDRFRWCASAISNTVLKTASSVVIGTMITNGFVSLYVDFGVEGTSEGDGVALFDYVNSTIGTPFENNGLLQDITGNMIPGTIDENTLINVINNALKYGIFEGIN